MLKLLLISAMALMAHDEPLDILVAETGINGDDLADTLLTNAINMTQTRATNQLSWTMAVTAGTSLVVVVKCYESTDDSATAALPLASYGQIGVCTANASATCAPDVRTFTLADYTAVDGVTYITTRWPTTKQFAKCSFDDPADGDGTIVVTGQRSWR